MPSVKKSTSGAFVCHACGAATAEWAAWCRACNYVGAIGWQAEFVKSLLSIEEPDLDAPVMASSVTPTEKICIPTGIVGVDRVLTGGFYKEKTEGDVRGSTVLLSGRRGGGKSRLTLAALSKPARSKKVLYVSSEEQVERLARYIKEGGLSDKIHLYHTLEFERAVALAVEGFKGMRGPFDLVAFDSAQKFKLEGGRKLTKLSDMLRETTKITLLLRYFSRKRTRKAIHPEPTSLAMTPTWSSVSSGTTTTHARSPASRKTGSAPTTASGRSESRAPQAGSGSPMRSAQGVRQRVMRPAKRRARPTKNHTADESS